jgi:RNA polymerase sigma factor (sigma-70 family)
VRGKSQAVAVVIQIAGRRGRSLDEMSDADLLKLASERADSGAFGAFYRRHQDSLRAFLIHHTRNPDVAQDLVAESFAVAYSKADRFDPARGDGRQWLFGIARIAMLANNRIGGVESATRRKIGVSTRGYTDEAWDHAEARVDSSMSEVVGGLRELGRDEREAVVARVIEDREYADIAQRQNVSEAAVRQRVSRGLRKLEKLVGRDRG